MNDILSQAEIDKLLNDLRTGEASTEQKVERRELVKNYDFRTANRFTKEQIRVINVIYKDFGLLLSNYLVGTLRSECQAEVVSIEEKTFSEFNNSVPSPVIIAIVNTEPFNGSIILEMTKEISFSIISRVLGGSKEISSEGRQFTEIELAIMERVMWQFLKNMDEAWRKMMDIVSTLEKIDTTMQFAQIVDVNEPVLMLTMNITIDKESGLIGFCLPHSTLEPFVKKLNPRQLYTGNPNRVVVSDVDGMKTNIRNTEITVSSFFNTTEATVRDIMSLHVGDVIQLQHKVNEPIIVKYQDVTKYKASVGKIKNKIAIKLVDKVAEDDTIPPLA
jgi:flagellar motor switch protein FliM